MPQSRGHLTLGERVEGGQVVEPRRGRHFRLGPLVSMRGLTIPTRVTDRKALTGVAIAGVPWLNSARHGLRRCRHSPLAN
jgi:hypothetical protein